MMPSNITPYGIKMRGTSENAFGVSERKQIGGTINAKSKQCPKISHNYPFYCLQKI